MLLLLLLLRTRDVEEKEEKTRKYITTRQVLAAGVSSSCSFTPRCLVLIGIFLYLSLGARPRKNILLVLFGIFFQAHGRALSSTGLLGPMP